MKSQAIWHFNWIQNEKDEKILHHWTGLLNLSPCGYTAKANYPHDEVWEQLLWAKHSAVAQASS